MQINDAGLALVKEREGYKRALPDGRCTTYYCPAGVLTIGWGCTEGIRDGDVWTKDQAEIALRVELKRHESAVLRLVSVSLNENQFSALVSFSYNVGVGALASSSLLKKLNKGDYAGAQRSFMDWNKATVKGKKTVLRGLSIRRAQEAALFALPSADEVQERGEPAMAQAIEPPKEPVGKGALVIGAGTISAGGAEAAKSFLGGPPAGVSDAVSSVGAWQGIAKTIGGYGEMMWSNPVATVAVFLLAVGAMWVIPMIGGSKS